MQVSEKVTHSPRLGAHRTSEGAWEFLLWAPHARSVSLYLCDSDEKQPMELCERGYHRAVVANPKPDGRYLYQFDDGRRLPDPASRYQPEGVHGPSQLVDSGSFEWTDQNWKGLSLERSIFYELHVGTFTKEGTYEALIEQLPRLVDLGVTTIELMPLAQFPGGRNWGYDGVYLFAPQNSYGTPESLQRLVNAAHGVGLAVALDVVYNHLGPEGNYLSAFGPYFTDRYRTPWGQAINFDGEDSDEVRRFFIENALYWMEEYHFDALRLDAVHGIFDFGARHFLAELKSSVTELSSKVGRPLALIAESDLNDARLLRDFGHGGYNLDSQWSDDFHHSVHALLTKEDRGYYSAFGGIEPLVETLRDGWYYSGQYSAYRKRHFGNSARGIAASKFVVCNQNHDQIGNRAAGDRLTSLVSLEALKLAAGITILSPFIPMLFMGEEYGETAPFQYFTSHGDADLVEAVRKGRREEFAAFGWKDSVPDPQDKQTFERSKLNLSLVATEPHQTLLRLYQLLMRTRKELELGSDVSRTVRELGDNGVLLRYHHSSRESAVIFSFADSATRFEVPELEGSWTVLIHSAGIRWKGLEPDLASILTISGRIGISPYSFLVLDRVQSCAEAE